jgi:tRNA (guanosine-2'-O-)-methyltransferase
MSDDIELGSGPAESARALRIQGALLRRISSVVVVVEAVRRRHNASAILRTAEAVGLHEAHLITNSFRPSRGAARGAERWLELHRHGQTSACIDALEARGFDLWVADLAPDARAPDEVPIDRPLAILFGSELVGVSDEARARARGVVTVPMRGLTESLNVSAAAACVLYRLAERRRAEVGGGDLDPERAMDFWRRWRERDAAARAGLMARISP